MILHIYTDGAARGNPGPAGAGAVLQVQSSKFPPIRPARKASLAKAGGRAGKVQSWRFKKFLGDTTNNQAEYQALILALCKARKLIGQNNFAIDKIICYSDSELLIKQLRREYKVKDKILGSLFVKIHDMSQNLPPIQYHHIQRENNKEADRLANKAIDKFSS